MKICGHFIRYPDGHEEQAKEILNKQLHGFIDELCEKEDFWLKCERDKTGKDLLKRSNTLGWKITIPHMQEED